MAHEGSSAPEIASQPAAGLDIQAESVAKVLRENPQLLQLAAAQGQQPPVAARGETGTANSTCVRMSRDAVYAYAAYGYCTEHCAIVQLRNMQKKSKYEYRMAMSAESGRKGAYGNSLR